MSFSAPAAITAQHQVEHFESGSDSLNLYLKRYALTNHASGSARTFVTCLAGTLSVAGYYALAAGAVEIGQVTARVAKGLPKHPVPVVLLARLAVDKQHQGRGLGRSLLQDALTRCLAVADRIGVRAVLVHAKDSSAAAFYSRYGFTPSPTDPLHLMLLIKDLRATLGES